MNPFGITPQGMRQALVLEHGRSCAAWVIWTHRRKIRHAPGKQIKFFLMMTGDVPSYFDIAMSWLRDHSKRWGVTREDTEHRKIWVLTYLPSAPKPVPSIIARPS